LKFKNITELIIIPDNIYIYIFIYFNLSFHYFSITLVLLYKMSINTIDNPIVEEHSFTYVNTLVDNFYKFIADIYIEYQKLKQIQDTNTNTDTKPLQLFPQFLLYKLYYNYGIKRRMSNDYIALLYYSKTAKGYKKYEPITMLCRHMLFDLRYMRIISLGIPKAIHIDDFCKTYAIDKTNQETNTNVVNTIKNEKYRLYYFTEGTMMTYNPSLKKYNITIINTESDDEDEDGDENKAYNNLDTLSNDLEKIDLEKIDLDKNIEIQFNNQFMYSTRKVLGTGSFGSNKSFLDMFEENNKLYNTDLSIIPSELIKDTVLVFNIEHPENNIISTIKRNTNTLCAVFKFKPEITSISEFTTIMSIEYLPDTPEYETLIYDGFKNLATNMVTQIQVSNYKKYLKDNNVNVNFYLPKIVKSFSNTNNEIIDIYTVNIEKLERIVNSKSKYFHGYILYGLNGERTKITNKKYKDLCELKGNKPIVIDQSNTKNLFYLYCRLLKQNNVINFLKEFDVDNIGNVTYKQIFMWFYTLLHNYSINLFKIYHYSFVKKTFNKPDIPYSLKPLCGDLHKMYKSNSTPITNTIVEQYLFELPASKLFWRLFKNNLDSMPTIQPTVVPTLEDSQIPDVNPITAQSQIEDVD
jgi:hypothetical protein